MWSFSRRLPESFQPNRLALLRERKQAAGLQWLDFTCSDPTRAGLSLASGLLEVLAKPAAVLNQVHPLGLPAARQAVAQDRSSSTGSAPAPVLSEDVILTASTSEAYSFLLKLLSDPGDEVLMPLPGYPLCHHLAALEGLRSVPYRLSYEAGWQLDLDSLTAGLTDRSRVLMIITPHNPTGWVLSRGEAAALFELASRHHLSIISDEVFADYVMTGHEDWSRAATCPEEGPALPLATLSPPVPCFSLGGLSKGAGLPQMKVGWILMGGPRSLRSELRERMEWIADLYLSVALPQQLALPAWLAAAAGFRLRLRERLCLNRSALAARLKEFKSTRLLDAAAGWSAILELPSTRSDEEDALALLDRYDLLVHPGYFFDLTRRSHLVLSLLLPPRKFAAGLDRLAAYLQQRDANP